MWEDTKNELTNLRTILYEKRGVRNQLLKSKQEELELLKEAQEEKTKAEKANLFLLSEITTRRKQGVEEIENIGSSGLKMMYGEGYALQFYNYEDARKTGANNFKMELQMVSPYGVGDKQLVTKLFGSRGGGGIEVSATSLRYGALDWLGYQGPIIFDETFKSMSKDRKIYMVAKWLLAIHDITNRQTILASHMGDIFGKIANKIIFVNNDIGKSSVREIEYDELLEELEKSKISEEEFEEEE